MNIDIRLAVGFWQHPKTHKLEKALGLRGVRSLQILWCWCAQNRPNGILYELDADDIEFVADWRGKKGAFFNFCLGNGLIRLPKDMSFTNGRITILIRQLVRPGVKGRAKPRRPDGEIMTPLIIKVAMLTICPSNAQAYAQAMPLPCPCPSPMKI